jgi:3-deoxy-7-phosphoheptulonate synthase
MIDCSHGNSSKEHKKQIAVCQDIVNQLSTASAPPLVSSGEFICGVMIESHLVEGRQNLIDKKDLIYGQSITDACIAWDDTVSCLENLMKGVDRRRACKNES